MRRHLPLLKTILTLRMQSPLSKDEPAHSVLMWPVEGAESMLLVVMVMDGFSGKRSAWKIARRHRGTAMGDKSLRVKLKERRQT